MQLGLILLACVGFISVGTILVVLKPRSHIGRLVVDRVLNSQRNWEKETLRSFVEVWVWICVNWYTFSAFKSIPMAISCATMTGVCAVGIGEYLAEGIRHIEMRLRGTISDREAEVGSQYLNSGSMMICVIYGYSVFSLIFDNVTDIAIACVLAATAGALLLFVAKLLAMCEPTRRAGKLLTRRIINAPSNWRRHTMRSALESTAWFGLIVANFAVYGELVFAFQTGTVGGILICLAGEYLTPMLYASDNECRERRLSADGISNEINFGTRTMISEPSNDSQETAAKADSEVNSIGDFFPWLTFTYAMAALIVLTSERWSALFGQRVTDLHWGSATVLYTVTGSGYVILGKVFMSMPSTRYVGKALTDRFVNTQRNWETQTARSLTETAFWLVVPIVVHLRFHKILLTITCGTVAGIAGVLASTLIGWGPVFASNENTSERQTGEVFESKHGGLSPVPISTQFPAQIPQAATKKSTHCKLHKERSVANKKKMREKIKLRRPLPVFEWSDVAGHNQRDDCWIVIRGSVYDVTEWGPRHPGGSIIYKYGGKDCTDQFDAFHRKNVRTRLAAYKIGSLSRSAHADLETKTSSATRAYRKLRKDLWEKGFFEPDAAYYNGKHAVWIGFVALAVGLVLTNPSPSQASSPFTYSLLIRCALGGIMLGMGWQQAAFMAHDALHNAVEKPKKGGGFNILGWLLGSPVFGISSGMWLEEHNMHHAITLRPREDPQVSCMPRSSGYFQ